MSIKKEESPQLLFFLNRVIWISSIFIFAGILIALALIFQLIDFYVLKKNRQKWRWETVKITETGGPYFYGIDEYYKNQDDKKWSTSLDW